MSYTATERKEAVKWFLEPKIQQAQAAWEKGHVIQARYLAMLVGAWMHSLGEPNVPPFNSVQEGDLYFYCSEGHVASADALGITREVYQAEQEEKAKERKAREKKVEAEIQAENRKLASKVADQASDKKSFWKMKLF